MTVQPFRPLPAPSSTPGSGTGVPVLADHAQGFMALLLAALPGAALPGGSGTEEPSTGSTDGDPTDVVLTGETADPAQPADPAVLAALALGVPAGLRPTVEPPVGTGGGTGAGAPGGDVPAGEAPATATTASASASGPAEAADTGGPVTGAAAPTNEQTGPAQSSDQSSDQPSAPAHPRAAEARTGQPGPLRLPDGLVAVEPAGAAVVAEATPPGSTTSSAGTSAAAPVTAPAPTAPAAPAPPAAAPSPMGDSAPSAEITRQVFPEIGRLVSRGDGTHRLTMTLNPAALGDVRVTLTVRDGAVTVSFAAADQAQAALLDGAPELRRLLESVGATESRVLVRDLPGSGLPDPTGGQAQERPGSQGREAPTDKHAGTRAEQPATDGSARGPGNPPPAHDPVTRRPGGVDVTV